jgi:hypothetical protein
MSTPDLAEPDRRLLAPQAVLGAEDIPTGLAGIPTDRLVRRRFTPNFTSPIAGAKR